MAGCSSLIITDIFISVIIRLLNKGFRIPQAQIKHENYC